MSYNTIDGDLNATTSCLPTTDVGNLVGACGGGIASIDSSVSGGLTGGTTSLTNVNLVGNALHGAPGELLIGGAIFCAGGHISYIGGAIKNTVTTASNTTSNGSTSVGEIGGGAIGLLGFPTSQLGGFLFGHASITGVAISGTSATAPAGAVIGGALFDGVFDGAFDHMAITGTSVDAGVVVGGAGWLELGDSAMSDSTISATTVHASIGASFNGAAAGTVLGGPLAYIGEEGIGALTLQRVGIDGTSATATDVAGKTSKLPAEVAGGAIVAVGAGLVADGLDVTNTSVTASGGDGVVGGGRTREWIERGDLPQHRVSPHHSYCRRHCRRRCDRQRPRRHHGDEPDSGTSKRHVKGRS